MHSVLLVPDNSVSLQYAQRRGPSTVEEVGGASALPCSGPGGRSAFPTSGEAPHLHRHPISYNCMLSSCLPPKCNHSNQLISSSISSSYSLPNRLSSVRLIA